MNVVSMESHRAERKLEELASVAEEARDAGRNRYLEHIGAMVELQSEIEMRRHPEDNEPRSPAARARLAVARKLGIQPDSVRRYLVRLAALRRGQTERTQTTRPTHALLGAERADPEWHAKAQRVRGLLANLEKRLAATLAVLHRLDELPYPASTLELIKRHAREALHEVRRHAPEMVCLRCKASGAACSTCLSVGWTSRTQEPTELDIFIEETEDPYAD